MCAPSRFRAWQVRAIALPALAGARLEPRRSGGARWLQRGVHTRRDAMAFHRRDHDTPGANAHTGAKPMVERMAVLSGPVPKCPGTKFWTTGSWGWTLKDEVTAEQIDEYARAVSKQPVK